MMIGRKAIVIISAKFLSAILGFIALFFMTRYLGPGIYGTIVWTIALIGSVNSLADLGFSSAHIKRVSEGKDLNQCVSTFAVVRLFLTVMMAIVTVSAVLIYVFVLDRPLVDTSFEVFTIFLLYYVIYDLAGIAIYTFDGRLETVLSQFSLLMDIAIRLPIVILVSINVMGAVELALAYLVGSVAMLSVSVYFLFKKGIKFGKPVLMRSYIHFALPAAAGLIIGTLASNIDKVTIGFFLTGTQVGYYSAAQSVLLIVASVGGAATTLFFPAFSKLHSDGNIREIMRKTWQAERYLSLLCVPLLIVFMVFPMESVTVLLGPKFTNSATVIQILSFSTLFVLINQPYAVQLYSANHPKISAYIGLVQLLVFFALLLVMVPTSILGVELLDLSIDGAAVAGLLSVLLSFLMSRYYTTRLTKVRSNPRIALHVLAGGATAGVLLMFSFVYDVAHWYDLVIVAVLSFGSYSAMLWALKEIRKGDIDYFLEILNPRKMKGYLVDELKGEK